MGHALNGVPVGRDPWRVGVLSTGQAARYCRVAPRTMTVWVDAGRVSGYRLPGSNARRIRADSLLAFMREAGMDVPPELESAAAPAVLFVGPTFDPPALPGCHAFAATTPVRAGLLAARHPPAVAVVDAAGVGPAAAGEVARALAGLSPRPVLIVAPTDDRPDPADWLAAGFDAVLPPPVTVAAVAAAVRAALGGGFCADNG